MCSYRVVSSVSIVPEMTGLEATFIEESSPQGGGSIAFSTGYQLDRLTYEPAVGKPCRIVRINDGTVQERGGTVKSVTPQVRVSLHGGGWN